MDDLEGRLDRMVASGEEDPDLMQAILSLSPADPRFKPIFGKLQSLQGDQPARPMMNIEDYYRPRGKPYELLWPLASPTARMMLVPFEGCDEKTQFFVLFQEWTRREAEASTARNAGDTNGARAGFEECLARAEQLEVDELRARSYEGLASVAEQDDDRTAARQLLEAAEAVRATA
jgi:hypothetical protein